MISRQNRYQCKPADGLSFRLPLFSLFCQAVHGPLEAPAETVAKFAHIEDIDRRIYAAMVYKLDEGIGNITKALKASGMYNNSVIIFSTDNG